MDRNNNLSLLERFFFFPLFFVTHRFSQLRGLAECDEGHGSMHVVALLPWPISVTFFGRFLFERQAVNGSCQATRIFRRSAHLSLERILARRGGALLVVRGNLIAECADYIATFGE